VTLHTREAHPGERYPQSGTFKRKLRHAREYQKRDDIPWPVAVNDIEGARTRPWTPKSNAAYSMDIQGTAAFRSLQLNDERVLREALKAIGLGRVPPLGSAGREKRPCLAGWSGFWGTGSQT
jgi:hypothetical protein